MTDIGVVGSASVTINPDFTGFAAKVKAQLLPVMNEVAASITKIDGLVKNLTRSLDGAVVPAQTLNTALDGIDAGDITAVGSAALTAVTPLEGMATAAEATNVALDAIDPNDLVAVGVAANGAAGALGGTAIAAQSTDGAMSKTAASAGAFGGAMKVAGIATVAGFATVAAASGIAIKAAVDFESAFTGVTKTVEGTADELSTIRQGIIDLSKELPASTTEIAAIAENAGALGVATPNILEFTKTMQQLADTTNVSAEDAATNLAKIANVLGTSQDEFDRLGAVLVDLGNKGASTEAEILAVANRVAAAGQTVGLTEQQVFGLSSTLANLGIRAEMGGSAIQKTFFDMQTAVDEGGEALAGFATVAGMSSEQFAATFKQDALAALQAFTGGLARTTDAGASASGVLADLGIKEVRQVQTLLKLSSAQDVFATDQANANKAWEENTALVIEADKRYATFESQMKILKNTMMDTARVVGESLLPPFLEMVRTLTTTLGPVLANLAATVGPALAGLLGSFAGLVAPIVDALAPVLRIMAEQLKPIIDVLAPVLGEIAGVFGEMAGTLLQTLGPVLLDLVRFGFVPLVQQLLPPLIQMFSDPVFLDAIRNIAGALTDILKALIDSGLLKAITDLMVQLGLPAIGAFRDAIVVIRDLMQSEDFKNGILTIKAALQSTFGQNPGEGGSLVNDWKASFNSAVDDFRRGLTDGKEPTEAWSDGLRFLKDEALDPVVGSIQQLVEWLGNLGEPLGWVVDGLEHVFQVGWDLLKNVLDPIVGVFQTLWDWADKLGNKFWDFMDKVPDFLKGNNEGGGGFSIPGFATGGIVPGPPGAAVPAIVHGGEMIIPEGIVSGMTGGSSVPFMGGAMSAVDGGGGAPGSPPVQIFVTVPPGTSDPQSFGAAVGDAAGDAFVRRTNIRTAVRTSPSSAR